MQKIDNAQSMFNGLPDQIKKLLPNPLFTPKHFQNITPKSVDSLVNYTKTKTLISLCKHPNLKQFQKTQINPNNTQIQPLILIFCQPSQEIQIDPTNSVYPYVPVAYCSWLQSLGAKCIPLPYNLNEGSMDFLLQRCHGLLIPGGGSNLYKNFQKKDGYGPVMVGFLKLWRIMNKMWQKGVYFPVWGTCLGLEMVLMAITNDTKVLSSLNSRGHQIEVYSDYENSRIAANMPVQLKIQIQNRRLINFQHVFGISVQKFINYPKICEKLKITGISKDKDGTWFCSMIEGKQNPIFLSQFHPEKQAYSWTLKGDILHQKYSILVSQYFGQAFLNECRKCKPSKVFISQKELIFYLIEQYRQIHTPQKMYKVYAIDYRFRYVDKEARKQIKSQRSISTSTTRTSLGRGKKVVQNKEGLGLRKDARKAVLLPPI